MNSKLGIFLISLMIITVYMPFSESESSEIVTFMKYYPDGSTETISIKTNFDEAKDKSNVIASKCKELLFSDHVFHHYMQNNSDNLFVVISGGSGLHINFPSSFFRSSIFDIIFSLFPSLMYCNYNSDAATNIFPFTSPDNSTDIIGEHKLFCIGFIGVVGWQNIISRANTGFAGLTLFYLLL